MVLSESTIYYVIMNLCWRVSLWRKCVDESQSVFRACVCV